MGIILDVFVDAIDSIISFFESNLLNIANLLNIMLPFVMFYLGYMFSSEHAEVVILLAISIPAITGALIYMFRGVANKIGKGTTMPMPEKRFTSVDDFGEASVDVDRVQELILYVADLEDWIERKHLK